MSLNLNIGNVSISGLETATTKQIELIISYLNNVKQNGLSLSEEKEKKYIFRATFIRMLADFLLENKVMLRENFYSVTSGNILYLSNIVEKIPEDYKRYRWLLDFDNFSILYGSLMNEIILHTTSTEPKEQDDKSMETLLELKRKL